MRRILSQVDPHASLSRVLVFEVGGRIVTVTVTYGRDVLFTGAVTRRGGARDGKVCTLTRRETHAGLARWGHWATWYRAPGLWTGLGLDPVEVIAKRHARYVAAYGSHDSRSHDYMISERTDLSKMNAPDGSGRKIPTGFGYVTANGGRYYRDEMAVLVQQGILPDRNNTAGKEWLGL